MFKKFASAAILDAQMGADAGFAKSAHRAVFNYTPRAGYLYVRSRAISSRCNDNFDAFPAEEIEKSYLTFIGKPVFVNHHNEDHRRARGVIIDAALHKDRNPDGTPDTWAEVLMEVDAVKFPKLAKAILAGEVDRTSMGCDVQFSKCSVCHNVASTPLEYCAHIPGKKGKKIYRVDPKTGEREATLVYEICSGLSFFENSLLVEAPADPTAFFLGNVEVGPGLEHLVASVPQKAANVKTASRKYRGDTWTNHCEAPGCRKSISAGKFDYDPNWVSEMDDNEEHHEFCSPAHAHQVMAGDPKFDQDIADYYGKRANASQSASKTSGYLSRTAAAVRPSVDVWGLLKQAAAPVMDYKMIGEDQARGNSRPVTEDEFHDLAQRGRHHLEQLAQHSDGTAGLDANWEHIKNHGYAQAQQSWGGATYNAHTGMPLETDADKYAITVRHPGMHSVSVPEHASHEEFSNAMDHARQHYGEILNRKDHHLGVFHDDDNRRIDIDPVLVVNHPHEVESIGAYTHAIGGAYHFKSGDGYFPPHVKGFRSQGVWSLLKQAADEEWAGKAAEHGIKNDFVRGFEGREVPDHGHPVAVYRDLSGAPKSGYPARGSWSIKHQNSKGNAGSHVQAHTVGLHITNAEPTFYEGARQHFKDEEKRGVHAFIRGNVHHYAAPTEHPEGEGWRQVSYYPDISHFFLTDSRNKYHGSNEAAFLGGKMWARGDIKEGDDGPVPMSRFEQPKTGKLWELIYEASLQDDDLYDWDFMVTAARPTEKNPGSADYAPGKSLSEMSPDEKKEHFNNVSLAAYHQARTSGSIKTQNYKDWKPVKEMTDEEQEEHHRKMGHVQGVADNWIEAHPIHKDNVVKAWNDADDHHKATGKTWYPDAKQFSEVSTHLANRTRAEKGMEPISHTQMSGLIGVYSPQTDWFANLHTALHVARTNTPIGGGKEQSKVPISNGRETGTFTSSSQRKQAQDILNGHHYNDALSASSHKVRSFSHLIEHGESEDHVVVDRHASSVAHGERLPDFVFQHAVMPKLTSKGGYETYSKVYRDATKEINKNSDEHIQPHMVQAATWLHRQKLNGRTAAKSADRTHRNFSDYAQENYPDEHSLLSTAPGVGHFNHRPKMAYGETKSPQDVDTLRSENCTVCGNSSAWDGTQCQVCGYIAPPRPFGDPNTDIAGQQDIRKKVLDGEAADPNDPNQQLGNQLGNPQEVEDQEDETAAGENVEQQQLLCDNCGTGVTPQAPTTDGEPPYPAEGDVCPVCKKGQLLGSADSGIEDPEADMDSVDAEEGQEGDAPGGASRNQLEEDDGDEDENSDDRGTESDDDNSEGEDSPFDKNKKQKKASSWKPSWWRTA